jgi:hypothetical protein
MAISVQRKAALGKYSAWAAIAGVRCITRIVSEIYRGKKVKTNPTAD